MPTGRETLDKDIDALCTEEIVRHVEAADLTVDLEQDLDGWARLSAQAC